jgi:hypothetical protein
MFKDDPLVGMADRRAWFNEKRIHYYHKLVKRINPSYLVALESAIRNSRSTKYRVAERIESIYGERLYDLL